MTQYGFYFDNSRCTGCRTCQMACMDYKDMPNELAFRKVYDYEGGNWEQAEDGSVSCKVFSYHVSLSCQHCKNPVCVKNCPTGAMGKDPETGIVSVDRDKCIGCGYCAMTCPYDAPKISRTHGGSVKCDGCKDRVAQGLKPICVGACPLRALDFGDIHELKEEHQHTIRGIAPMPDPSITDPSIRITASFDAQVVSDTKGYVSNPKEVK